jgi:hypothetical protein
VVLAKHGLVTWGETHEESYGLTRELVARATEYVARRRSPTPPTDVAPIAAADRERLLLRLRGRLSREHRCVLTVDAGQRALAARPDVTRVATAARATPDHILRIGAASVVVRAADEIPNVVDTIERAYRDYFARHQTRLPAGLGMLSSLPKVALVPGLGCVAAGADIRAARVNAEIAYRSHLVTATTLDAFGAIAWLTEAEVFDFDYWPLELAKLAAAPAPRPFAGRVVVISGAAGSLTQAIADRLADDGAHLVLVEDDPRHATAGLDTAATTSRVAVSAEGDPIGAAIAAFGGVDGLIVRSPPSPALIARFAGAVVEQGLEGVVVALGNVDSVASVGGALPPDAPIRLNGVHAADGANPTDVAEAIAFLASERSRATRGAMLPVVGP